MPKLTYIGGYGHSGSTILEYMMTINPEIVAFGEVVNSRNEANYRRCTCGRPAKDCSVWGFLFNDHSSNRTSLSHTGIVEVLLERSLEDYAVGVDSSKTAWGTVTMPFRLRRRLREDFLLIHLVRDPRGVCWSNIQRAGRKNQSLSQLTKALECCLTSIGWLVANLSCEAFNLMYPAQYICVRYEDFSQMPEKILIKLFNRLLPSISMLRGSEGNANRHQLHGNRVRRQLLSISDVKEDIEWKVQMPFAYRWLALRLSAPLRRKYGYF
jgi:hypothetical protein